MFPRRALMALLLGMLLPGCPLTDHYFIEPAGQGAMPDGAAGSSATGGTPNAAGAPDGVGGDAPSDGGSGDTAAMTGDAGAGATGGDTSLGGTSGSTLTGGAGGTTSVGGSGGTTPLGGAGGTSSLGGSGGTLGGDSGTGGDMTGSGGATAGSPAAGMGGTTASGGDGQTGGATAGGAPATGGMGVGGQYQPLCDDSVVKGATCSHSSPHMCYRTCGPDSVGFKSETCQGTAYVEGNCQFPMSGDYSCYAIPPRLPAACPAATVPRAADTCDVAACTPCFGGTTNNPLYEDSTGTQKQGYCVCSDAGVWTCATSADPSSWPCPGNSGC